MKQLLLLLFCMLTACDDFIETDLSQRSVQIVAPKNGSQLTDGVIVFRWNAMTGASGYRFVMVSESFADAQRVLADTLIFADSLSHSYGCSQNLTPGRYEWSVSAFNAGYRTAESVQSLTITAEQ